MNVNRAIPLLDASIERLESLEPMVREQIQALNNIPNQDLPRATINLFKFFSRLSRSDDLSIERTISWQDQFIHVLLTRLLTDRAGHVDHEIPPRRLQVLVLMQLLFAKRDVLLVAQTGFGKSLIFQAIGLLTGKITIIVAPVMGLYDQILNDISEIPGAKPIVISSETRGQYAKPGRPRDIYSTIMKGSYTHIILGPEQLLVPEFRALVRNLEFRDRIGALVVDEAHCVALWSSFRPEYTQIHSFRRVLPKDVRLFGCTGTLNLSIQRQIVQRIGFDQRPEWNDSTGIIRASSDRPDLRIVIVDLPSSNLFTGILFSIRPSLEAATQSASDTGNGSRRLSSVDSKTLLEEMFSRLNSQDGQDKYHSKSIQVEMTVIFATTRAEVRELKEYIRKYLIQHGCSQLAANYLVKSYTSKTGKRDRARICDQMKQGSNSETKILVATSAFGMGLNIVDIKNVVQFRGPRFNPSSKTSGDLMVADIWQRGGRAARKKDFTGMFYICVEADILQKENRWRKSGIRRHAVSGKLKNSRHQANKNAPRVHDADSSIASQHESDVDSTENVNDADSDGSVVDNEVIQWLAQDANNADNTTTNPNHRRYTHTFLWSHLQVTACKRRYMLEFLGEDMVQEEEGVIDRVPIRKEDCCSGCNPSMVPDLISYPRPEKLIKPRAGSKAGIALTFVEEWAAQEACEVLLKGEKTWFVEPPGSWLFPDEIRFELARHPWAPLLSTSEVQWGQGSQGQSLEETLQGLDNGAALAVRFRNFMTKNGDRFWRESQKLKGADSQKGPIIPTERSTTQTPRLSSSSQVTLPEDSVRLPGYVPGVSEQTRRVLIELLRSKSSTRPFSTQVLQPSALSQEVRLEDDDTGTTSSRAVRGKQNQKNRTKGRIKDPVNKSSKIQSTSDQLAPTSQAYTRSYSIPIRSSPPQEQEPNLDAPIAHIDIGLIATPLKTGRVPRKSKKQIELEGLQAQKKERKEKNQKRRKRAGRDVVECDQSSDNTLASAQKRRH